MSRQSVLALGLLILTLAIAPTRFVAAEEPKAKDAHAPSATTKAEHATAKPEGEAHGAAAAAEHGAAPAAGHAPAAEASHGGGHDAGAQPNILEPQAPLAIWTVVVFVVLLTVLGKFAWKPLLKALHDREEHIEHALHETEKARNEAERLMAENQKNLNKAQEQVRAMLEEAKKVAEVTAASIVERAQTEAEAARDRAEREINTAKDQALTEIFSKTTDLAVSIAGKVLQKDMNESDHRRLVEVAMNELPSMPSGQGTL
jgi:F-type H+-transporting ATPase subunit b